MSKTRENGDAGEPSEIVSVSRKGQATIPKELRERHGIDTPGRVRFRENEEGEIVVEPVGKITDMRGAAESKILTDELRRERERDEERYGRLDENLE